MQRLQELVRLHRLGDGPREVARKLKMSPNTERAYRLDLIAAGLLEGDPEQLPDLKEIQAAIDEHRELGVHVQESSIESFRTKIEDLIASGAGPKAIFDRLLLEDPSFPGSLSAVKRLVAKIRRTSGPRPEEIAIPVQTKPGHVAQVDFGEVGRLWDSYSRTFRRAFVFVMVLGYSRHMFAKIVFDQKIETWLRLHVEAFEHFGGVPQTVVPDNLKSAVIRAAFDVRQEPTLNQSYRELGRHFGFTIDPTPPYSPQKKGKVENGVRYVKRNYIATLGTARDRDPINDELMRWVMEIAGKRCHGTTFRQPLEHFLAEERDLLLPMPERRWEPRSWHQSTVHRDACIVVAKSRYSVPWRLVGKKLRVRLTATSVQAYWENARVATHKRVAPGEKSINLKHLPEQRAEYGQRDHGFWLARAEKLGPNTLQYITELFASDDVLEQVTKVQAIVRYLETFPRDRAEAACRRASFYGSYTYLAMKRILEKSLDLEPIPLVQLPIHHDGPHPRFARSIYELLDALPTDHDASH